MMVVLDATDQVLGRFASLVAKRLLAGDEVHVLNAEKAIVTGKRLTLLAEYLDKRHMGSTTGRIRGKGPYYPRRPDRILILRRAVRGMLPYQKPHGREALKRLRVYVGVPPEFEGKAVETVPAGLKGDTSRYTRLGVLSSQLGAKFE